MCFYYILNFTDIDLNSLNNSSNDYYQELSSHIDFNSNLNNNNDPVRPDSTVPQMVNSDFSQTKIQNIDLGDPTNIYDSFWFWVNTFIVIVQKFRKNHFMKWLADSIANKTPNNKVFWNTKLTLHFIKYEIKY